MSDNKPHIYTEQEVLNKVMVPSLGESTLRTTDETEVVGYEEETDLFRMAPAERLGYLAGKDDDFVAGDSPVEIDFETPNGRLANRGYLVVHLDGVATLGEVGLEIDQGDGGGYGDVINVSQDMVFDFEGMGVSKIRITHLGTDSAYRYFLN